MLRSLRSRAGVVALTATMGLSATALAVPVGAAGNSTVAKSCQKGGWQTWMRADYTPFTNQGDCVSYGAVGGTLTQPKSASQLLCESYGGTFTATPVEGLLWTCTQLPDIGTSRTARFDALAASCFADGGAHFFGTSVAEADDCIR